MTTNRYVAASFAVNIDHLHALGVRDPYSEQSLQLYHSGKLNANERLYFSLWGSSELSTSLIRAKTRFARLGEPVSSAFFVIKGQVLGVQGDQIYRLGPGSVIGLAEGVGGLSYSMDAIAVDDVQVRVFPMYTISKLVKNMPPGLKGIFEIHRHAHLAIDNTSGSAVMTSFDEIKLEVGDVLFNAGEPADKLYFIQSGAIQMADKNTGAVFATLREGDSFGEQAMLQGGIRGATAKAGEPTVLLEITAEGLRGMLKTASPILTAVFEAMMLQQNMHNGIRSKA